MQVIRLVRALVIAAAGAFVGCSSAPPSGTNNAIVSESSVAPSAAPTTAPSLASTTAPSAAFDYTIPAIPVERIKFSGTGYPQIPDDVQKLIDRRQEVWDRLSADAFQRAMPEVERAEKAGRPFVRVAREPSDLPKADIPAFPGAQGGGMYTAGGRGGKVFIVTSLNDSGPGTFREACEAGGPRIVVFNVAGIIQLERPLDILAPYITIAGQSAPGDGICIAGHTTHIRTHDVIIRYTRFRRGIHDISNRDDTLSGDAIGNVIIDHCSTSWGNDETLSVYRQMYAADPSKPRQRQKLSTINNSIQWTIISESLDTYHHGFGATWGGTNAAFHHNLFACNTGRNPSISSRDFTFANNVLFNWRHRTLDGGARTINVINNYFKPGPATEGQLRYRVGKPEGGAWYATGNFVVGNETVTKDNWAGGIQHDGDQPSIRGRRLTEPGPMPQLTIEPAEQAYEAVLNGVGATLPVRDPVDTRIVNQVRTGEVSYPQGKGIITDISQVGGYPQYKGSPYVYPMNDGIADGWKTKYKLDLNDATLAAKDTDGDGYTTIEEFLNGTDPNEKVDYKDLKNNINSLGFSVGADCFCNEDSVPATSASPSR